MTRKKGRRTAAPPGTAPKVARRDKPFVYIKRKEVLMREESVAEREAAVTAQEAALAEDKAALAAVKAAPAEEEAAFAKKLAEEKAALAKVKATLAKDKADLKVRVKAMERAEARHAAERAAAKAAQEKADRRRPNQDFDEAQAAQAREDLKPRPGALLDESQSRMILMLYFHLVLEGDSPNAAVNKTACTVRVGVEKVLKIRKHWLEKGELLSTSGDGRGAMRGVDDKRRCSTRNSEPNSPTSSPDAQSESG